jgi:anhydro-N-acetylmuramic acid kinase
MKATGELYLGLMSGTSMDGIDAAIVRLGSRTCEFVAGTCVDYPAPVRSGLLLLRNEPHQCSIDTIGQLDTSIGECFAKAAVKVIESSGVRRDDIVAIGSHGQTVRHQPDADPRFTLQIGDPNVISALTGITVVADFRRADLAVGGQGAPLAPAFHEWIFADNSASRAILNIGGIANITLLPAGGGPVIGFDIGPGNTLLDAWISRQLGRDFDEGGLWSAAGSVCGPLLDRFLQDRFFAVAPPKSTGFEYFNLDWVDNYVAAHGGPVSAQDLQATLAELSCRSIADAIRRHAQHVKELFVCGGGFRNHDLMMRLGNNLPGVDIRSTLDKGLDPDWVEAAAFAWLARCRLEGTPGNLPSVTGAAKRALLGGIFAAAR